MEKIILYVTPWCKYCDDVRNFLTEKGIEFKEVNIALDRKGLKELRRKSGQIGVPVLDVNGEIVIGFSPEKIEKALNKALKTKSKI